MKTRTGYALIDVKTGAVCVTNDWTGKTVLQIYTTPEEARDWQASFRPGMYRVAIVLITGV